MPRYVICDRRTAPVPPTTEAVLQETMYVGECLSNERITEVINNATIDHHLMLWLKFRESCRPYGTPGIKYRRIMLTSREPLPKRVRDQIRRTYRRWYDSASARFQREVARHAARVLDSLTEEAWRAGLDKDDE